MPAELERQVWEAFFTQSADPCFVYVVEGPAQFRLVAVNDAWKALTRRGAADVGRTLDELAPEVSLELLRGRFERCVLTQEVVDFDDEQAFGGEPLFWHTRLVPLVIDGRVRYVAGSARDYTELRNTARALSASETKFRRMVENASDIIYRLRLDPVGFDYISPSIELITGYPPSAFYENPYLLRDVIHPDDRASVDRSPDQLHGETSEVLARWVHKDGTVRWVEARSVLVEDSAGRPVAREGIARDMTELRRREEERTALEKRLQQTQKLESLGVLAGGIAHDFNNLLTGIIGHASLMRMNAACPPALAEHAQQVELAATRAADLCRQMLAYSGKGRFSVRRLDLDALVRETTQLLKLSTSKSTELELSLHASHASIEGDPTQLQQVIMNLVLNASEALEGKPGTVRVTTGLAHVAREELKTAFLSPELPSGRYAFLEVSDTGAGMDTETQARIFDPFFTTKFTGRGLGLSAVLGIVRGHSGAIRVDSQAKVGTVFRVLLPAVDGAAPSSGRASRPSSALRSGTVLVVDDEEIVRKVTARILEALGYSVVTAVDGRDGVDTFRAATTPFVAVLMDLTMPKLDGVAACEAIRELDPRVPVLLMSGFNEQDAIARFAGAGLAGFLQKPFTTELLDAKLLAALRKA